MSPGAPSMSIHPAGAPRRCLVTGGAGFIGSHLTDLLLARADHVTVIDDLSTGRRINLPASHPRMRFIEGDLEQTLAALPSSEHFDEIYHLAAAVGVKLVLDDPVRAIETNVGQTSAVLRFAAHRSGIPILIASSSEVYGKGTHSTFREDDDVSYGPTTALRWSYACSKALDEYLALAYHARRGLAGVVVRFFNTVGPRQVGEYGMVLPRFVEAALDARPLEVFGDGTQSRCFCDVRDVVTVLPTLLRSTASHGRVFNVGSDRSISIRDLAETVVRELGSRSPIVLVPYSKAYQQGFEDLGRRVPDLSRVRQAGGFAPRITLEQTIRDLAELLRSRRAGAAGTPVVAGGGA